jgi:predicted peptidase
MKLSAGLSRRAAMMVLGALWLAMNVAFVAWPQPARRSETAPVRFGPLSASTLKLYETPAELHVAGQLPFRLLSPPAVATAGRFPLLVFLHGAGQRGRDNQEQLRGLPEQMIQPDWRQRFPCFLLAPQCAEAGNWSEWMEDLELLIARVCHDFPVDQQRVYLTGLSMGGFGSWELAARNPERFAGVVPICGGGDISQAMRLKRVPIWAVHGEADEIVSVENTRQMIQALRDAGGQPLYTELAGVGHNSWSQTYRNPRGVLQWLFAQVNDRPSNPPQTSR